MSVSEISKRYAKALYDSAKSSNQENAVFDQLRVLGDVFKKNPDIQSFFSSPMNPPDQKLKVLAGALKGKVAEELSNLFNLLVDKNRPSLFLEIVEAYELISDEANGVTRGTVKSASPLSAEAQKKLEETITKVTGKKVILSFQEDPSLLGGMVAQVAGWTFNDSIESHLTRLSEDLNRRAN